MHDISGLVASIGKFIYNGDKGTDKGADSTFHTEIGQDGCFIFHQTDDSFGAIPNAYPATRAFENIYMWYHKHLLFDRIGDGPL